MIKKFFLVLFLPLVLLGCKPTSLNVDQPLQADNTVHRGQLDNGFKYIIKENHRPSQSVTLYFVVKAGSINETDEQQGLAHFLEHMAFYSSQYFTGDSVGKYFESIGATFGAHTNAYTSFNETVYMLTIPLNENKDEVLDQTFNIIKGWASGLNLNNADIDKERPALLEEKRSRLSANQRIFNLEWPWLVNHSRYAYRLPIGQEEVLKNADHTLINSYYQEWYQSQLQGLIVVGSIDKHDIEQRIKTTFSPRLAGESQAVITPITLPTESVFQVNTDSELTRNTLTLYYPVQEEQTYNTVADLKQLLSQLLLNHILDKRLEKLTQQPDTSLMVAESGTVNIDYYLSYFALQTLYKEGQALQAYKQLAEILEQAKQFGFTETELYLAKTEIMSLLQSNFREMNHKNSGEMADTYVSPLLNNKVITDAAYELKLGTKLLATLTTQDIQTLLQTFTQNKPLTFVSAPNASLTPTSAQLQQFALNLTFNHLQPYILAKTDNESLFPTPPTKGHVIKTETLAQGVTLWTLANGIQVYVKNTPFQNDEILLYALAPGGYYQATDMASAVSALWVLNENGLGQWNKEQLNQKLTGIDVKLSPFFKNYSKGFSGSATKANVEDLLQLLRLYADSTLNNTTAFNRVKDTLLQQMASQQNSPAWQFSLAQNQALYGNTKDPLYSKPTSKFYQDITLEQTNTFYTKQINTASLSNFTYFFVGSFNEKNLKSLVETYLGSLSPALNTNPSYEIATVPTPLTTAVIIKSGQENQAQLMVNYSFFRPFNANESIKWSVLERLTEMRLFDALRGEAGATYSPSVQMYREEQSDRVNLTIKLTLEPSRVTEIEQLITTEIEDILASNLDNNYYDKAKKTLTETEKNNQETNHFWINLLSTYHKNGLNFSQIDQRKETLNQINKANMAPFLQEISQDKIKSVAIRLPN